MPGPPVGAAVSRADNIKVIPVIVRHLPVDILLTICVFVKT